MRNKWVIGLLMTALAILAIVVLVGGTAGLLLGALLLLVTIAIAGIATHVKVVPERKVLVINSALHGAVIRVVPGPAVTFLQPFREVAGESMDTEPQLEKVYVEDVLQADQQPTILSFIVLVSYQLAPQNLDPAHLGQILPKLTGDLGMIVRHWTDYCLSSLMADIDPASFNNDRRIRLERQLKASLSARLAGLGIAVQGAYLKANPPAGLQNRMLQAEQERVDISIQADQLAAILSTLTGRSLEAHDLAKLKLAESLGHNRHNLVRLHLRALLDNEEEQAVPVEGIRFPQLERLLHSND